MPRPSFRGGPAVERLVEPRFQGSRGLQAGCDDPVANIDRVKPERHALNGRCDLIVYQAHLFQVSSGHERSGTICDGRPESREPSTVNRRCTTPSDSSTIRLLADECELKTLGIHRLPRGHASRLLPDKFIVSPPCSFANHPSRRGLDRPTVAVNRDVVAPHGCRQTTRAAMGRDETPLSASSAPHSPVMR